MATIDGDQKLIEEETRRERLNYQEYLRFTADMGRTSRTHTQSERVDGVPIVDALYWSWCRRSDPARVPAHADVQ